MADRYFHIVSDDFHGARSFTTTPDANGWTFRAHGSATPTVAMITPSSSGAVLIAADATSAAQSAVLSDNDILSIPTVLQANPMVVGLKWFNVVASIGNNDSSSQFFIGLASADNATYASVATRLGFKIVNSEVYCESVNSTVSITAIDSGVSLTPGTQYLFAIDFAFPTDVRFLLTDTGTGACKRICGTQKFDFSAYTGSLQRYLRCEKLTGASTKLSGLTIDRVRYAIKTT